MRSVFLTVGGGEVLDYVGKQREQNPYFDWEAVKTFAGLPYVKGIIIGLIVFISALIMIRILRIKVFKGRGMASEMGHARAVKSREQSIIWQNKMLRKLTKFIESTPLASSKSSSEYWNYNLTRAMVKNPGGMRTLKAEEFNALTKSGMLAGMAVGVVTAILFGGIAGIIIIGLSILLAQQIPLIVLRIIVKKKDDEIINNFSDYYLMLHYVLLAGAKTPLSSVMKSFAKMTDSVEMTRYIDNCIHYIDTYGEYEATRYIARDYREIAQIGKLMRLIRQSNEGGDVREELLGFRKELINEKKYVIERRCNKQINKAKASFNILVILLIQAILSAMAIYFKDIGGLLPTILGGG